MSVPQGFQRARLEIDGQDPIECAFNPQSYTVTKTNVWNFKPTTGVDLPDGEFGGGLPRRTRLSLLLDVSLLGPDESVKDTTNRLLKMMETGGGGGGGASSAPPFVTFRWGSVDLPKSVPVTLTIQHILFHPNGEPIRATVDLELAQAERASTASSAGADLPQNPTTRALQGVRTHRMRAGDTLQGVAWSAYGDPTRWRAIAEANAIDDPLRVPRGTELTIPPVER
jgi:hypothetical protein